MNFFQRRISSINVSKRMGSVQILKFLVLISAFSVLLTSINIVGGVEGSSYGITFIPWGQKCRIPKPGEFLLPSEDCDESKGITCQKYSQGDYCGCRINSMLSYDRLSGECRRMPYHHCVYVNTTANPDILKLYPYQVKCHDNADCVIKQPHPDKKTEGDKPLEICECKPGFVVSKDLLECVNVNFAANLIAPTKITLTLISLITLSFSLSSKSLFHVT